MLIRTEPDAPLRRYIGVDTIFIRENADFTQTSILPMLAPYLDAGVVDFGLFSGDNRFAMGNWANECARHARVAHQWVASIDSDEFIVPLHRCAASVELDVMTVASCQSLPLILCLCYIEPLHCNTVHELLEQNQHDCRSSALTWPGSLKWTLSNSFHNVSAIALQRLDFGTSGFEDRPENGSVAGFMHCTGKMGYNTKVLAQTAHLHPLGAFSPGPAPRGIHEPMLQPGSLIALGDKTQWTQPQEYCFVETHWQRRNDHCSARCVGISWVGGLNPIWRQHHCSVGHGHMLILNQYVTRARRPFVERKISNAAKGNAGVIGKTFARIYASMQNMTDEHKWRAVMTAMDGFERDLKLDQQHEICLEGQKIAAAMLAMDS